MVAGCHVSHLVLCRNISRQDQQMTPKERAAMQQALSLQQAAQIVRSTAAYVEADVEECMGDDGMVAVIPLDAYNDMMEAIAALREALEQPVQEGKCNQHPDAPHGFDRNASHSAGRYVCECEGWEPEQPVSQEPVVLNIAAQCRATASSDIAYNILVDDGNGTLRELLLDAATYLEKSAPVQPVSQEPVKREHITDGSPCWCNPELNYKDTETGAEVWVHKEPQ